MVGSVNGQLSLLLVIILSSKLSIVAKKQGYICTRCIICCAGVGGAAGRRQASRSASLSLLSSLRLNPGLFYSLVR